MIDIEIPSVPVIRILHLLPKDGIGGVEVAAKSINIKDDSPYVFRLLFIEPSNGKSIISIKMMTALWRSIKNNIRAFGEARDFSPDVIICSLWRSVPLALVLRLRLRKAKLAFFIHNNIAMHGIDAAMSWVAIRVADIIWGDSAATLAARGIPGDRASVVSFVTDRFIAPDNTGASSTFVSWGRLSHQKGIDRSIQLIAILAERGLDVQYHVYGPDGGERENLEALARRLNVDDRVQFLGPVRRSVLSSIAAQHRFFLQLSRSEGMCMAAVEAMQLGLVPVATAAGEMARYVRSGDTGISVDPDNMVAAADAVERLIREDTWSLYSERAARLWLGAPLYADDVCQAARSLATRARHIEW